MIRDNIDDDTVYIPDEEEQKEINEILNREELEKEDREQPKVKNRIYHLFNTESQWVGWLKVNGIRW